MGSVEVGDIVYDKMGEPTKILHTSNVHNKKCYKVKFDNNVEIIADYDHRWEITYGGYNKNKIDVMTSEELFNYCNEIKGNRIQGTIPRVVINKPLSASNNDFEIDPYVFGVWLGDGHSSCGMVTNMYDEIFDEIANRGFTVGEDVSQGGAGKAKSRTIYGLRTLLNKHGLLNNKHLPKEVIMSSYEYRKQVLGGLMDTDGYYHPSRKRFVLSTSRSKQVDFCVHLLSSMGIKSTVIKNYKKLNSNKIQCFDVTFTCGFNPFFKRRVNVDFPKQDNHSFSNVKEVVECETVPTRCIEVDSPTHTFLYGDHFMVTHNTNKDLYKNFRGKTLLYPFNELLDMPLSIYKLQLSLYQSCLEKIGMKVIARRILWLKPEGIYDKINLEEYVSVLREELKNKNLTPRNHE
jgi:replicative DNA helicase